LENVDVAQNNPEVQNPVEPPVNGDVQEMNDINK